MSARAHQAAAALLFELQHADSIIKVMLNAMTAQQNARVAEKFETDRIVTDGINRHHERGAAIETAKEQPALPTRTSTSYQHQHQRPKRQTTRGHRGPCVRRLSASRRHRAPAAGDV